MEMNPGKLMQTLKTASNEEKLEIGLSLIRARKRGLFMLTEPFYREVPYLSCRHDAVFAAMYREAPDDWFNILPSDKRFALAETDFNIMTADARCECCLRHARDALATGQLEEWKVYKLREIFRHSALLQ
jgi:hypothetical protein